MAGGFYNIQTNPYSRDTGAQLVPFLSQAQQAPSPTDQAAIAAGLRTGLMGGTEQQAQAAGDLAKTAVQAVQQDAAKQQAAAQAAQLTPDQMIQRAISLQDNPDQMKEKDVLYPLPIGNGRWDSGDIYTRPFVDNGDGTTSTMVSQVFTDDNGNHVIMNVTPDGKVLSDEKARQRYYNVGDNGIATFDNLDEALKFDEALHPREVQRLKYRNDPTALQQYAYDLQRADHPERFSADGSQYTGPQAQPQTASDTVTQATLQGAAQDNAKAQAQQAAQQAQQIPLQRGSILGGLLSSPNMTMVNVPVVDARALMGAQQPRQPAELTPLGRDLANQLIQAKKMYQKAQAANSQKGMEAAHAAALSIQDSARAAGIDLSQYGSDVTLQNAAQNLQNDYYRGLQNSLYGDLSMTSDDYYNNIYNRLRQNGYSDKVSRNVAAKRAGQYQAQRMAKLQDALFAYGMSPRGSINQTGARLLYMMSGENANAANYYANMFAGPKQDYAFNRQQDTAATQQQYNQQNMATKQQYSLQQLDVKAQINQKLKVLDGQIKIAEQNNDYALKAQLQKQKYELQNWATTNGIKLKAALGVGTGRGGGGSKKSSGGDSGDNLNSNEVVSVITHLIEEGHSPSYIYTYLMDAPGVHMNDNEFQYYWNLPSIQKYFHQWQGDDADPSYSYIDNSNENG